MKKIVKRTLIVCGSLLMVMLLLLSVSIYDLASDPEFVGNLKGRLAASLD
jgi:hypothetical protein